MREYLLIFLWFFLVSLPAQPSLITYLEVEQDLFFKPYSVLQEPEIPPVMTTGIRVYTIPIRIAPPLWLIW
ncbi:MAG TPA: hypothetical protein DDX07_12665 [Porphyromonadaceae bacterium]|nr:hypothetical protein [Porphyromonadaceae bacterium]